MPGHTPKERAKTPRSHRGVVAKPEPAKPTPRHKNPGVSKKELFPGFQELKKLGAKAGKRGGRK